MNNVVIDIPQRIDGDIEDFKIDAVEEEKNFTSSRIRVCRDPEKETPVIFYTQELNRNFKNPTDQFGRRFVLKTFTPNNAMASADTALENKFGDTVLAHKERIHDYSPLTDIHSQKMNLFIDDESATYLSDVGINIDGLGEDFQGIESVEATPFMEDIAMDTERLKSELWGLQRGMKLVKDEMMKEVGDNYFGDDFEQWLSIHKISNGLVQKYLSAKEKIDKLEEQLRLASNVVFDETKTKIRLPPCIHEEAYAYIF